MSGRTITFSAHALSRMAQRTISEKQVLTIVTGGARVPEPASAGAATRWRYAGWTDGRFLTVIVAQESAELIVITAY